MTRESLPYPTGPTHWNGPLDIVDSPAFYVPMACDRPRNNVIGPEIVEMPVFPQWTASGEWSGEFGDRGRTMTGNRALDPRSFASYTECLDARFGSGDCYESDALRQEVEAFGAGTLTAQALATHRQARAEGVDQGIYTADSLRLRDPALSVEQRGPAHTGTGTFVEAYVRESSGGRRRRRQPHQLGRRRPGGRRRQFRGPPGPCRVSI